MEDEISRIIRIEERYNSVKEHLINNDLDHKQISNKIDLILNDHAEVKGYIKALRASVSVLISVVLGISAAIGWIFEHVYAYMHKGN